MNKEEVLAKKDEVIKALQALNNLLNAEQHFMDVSAVSTSILRIQEAYLTLELGGR